MKFEYMKYMKFEMICMNLRAAQILFSNALINNVDWSNRIKKNQKSNSFCCEKNNIQKFRSKIVFFQKVSMLDGTWELMLC